MMTCFHGISWVSSSRVQEPVQYWESEGVSASEEESWEVFSDLWARLGCHLENSPEQCCHAAPGPRKQETWTSFGMEKPCHVEIILV